MPSPLRKILVVSGCIVAALLLLRKHYVLSSAELNDAIEMEIPVGSPKARVVSFLQKRHPVAYDDNGLQIMVRFSGRAENVLYRKDIVLILEFSSDNKLSCYSAKTYLSFV